VYHELLDSAAAATATAALVALAAATPAHAIAAPDPRAARIGKVSAVFRSRRR
jgi:hypothetical protein